MPSLPVGAASPYLPSPQGLLPPCTSYRYPKAVLLALDSFPAPSICPFPAWCTCLCMHAMGREAAAGAAAASAVPVYMQGTAASRRVQSADCKCIMLWTPPCVPVCVCAWLSLSLAHLVPLTREGGACSTVRSRQDRICTRGARARRWCAGHPCRLLADPVLGRLDQGRAAYNRKARPASFPVLCAAAIGWLSALPLGQGSSSRRTNTTVIKTCVYGSVGVPVCTAYHTLLWPGQGE